MEAFALAPCDGYGLLSEPKNRDVYSLPRCMWSKRPRGIALKVSRASVRRALVLNRDRSPPGGHRPGVGKAKHINVA